MGTRSYFVLRLHKTSVSHFGASAFRSWSLKRNSTRICDMRQNLSTGLCSLFALMHRGNISNMFLCDLVKGRESVAARQFTTQHYRPLVVKVSNWRSAMVTVAVPQEKTRFRIVWQWFAPSAFHFAQGTSLPGLSEYTADFSELTSREAQNGTFLSSFAIAVYSILHVRGRKVPHGDYRKHSGTLMTQRTRNIALMQIREQTLFCSSHRDSFHSQMNSAFHHGFPSKH